MNNSEIILFGAGNLSSNVIEILNKDTMNILGFISTEPAGTFIHNYPVLGDMNFYLTNIQLQKIFFHIAIGENSIRYKLFDSLKNNEAKLLSVISDRCCIASNCTINNGTYISNGALIQHHVTVGKCCIIDTGAIIEHHVFIGDFVNISPGAILCGKVIINTGAIIGAGATIIEKVEIGENTLIGAGSVVIHDIEPNVVAVGNPARIIKKRDFFDTYLK